MSAAFVNAYCGIGVKSDSDRQPNAACAEIRR